MSKEKVITGFIVKATVEGRVRKVSTVYTCESAADHFRDLLDIHNPESRPFVTPLEGYEKEGLGERKFRALLRPR